MGLVWRKVFRFGPVRTSLSTRGLGWSSGIPFLRYGIGPNSTHYLTIGVPGAGLYFTKFLKRGSYPLHHAIPQYQLQNENTARLKNFLARSQSPCLRLICDKKPMPKGWLRSQTHGSICIQEGQPIDPIRFSSFLPLDSLDDHFATDKAGHCQLIALMRGKADEG
jgi:hypothetical protein